MKRIALFMAAALTLCVTSCAQKTKTMASKGKALVAYFSATGTTEGVAKQIAEVTGGTLYEIKPQKEYSQADLDWTDKQSRSSVEMADPKSRPAIIDDMKDLSTYDTVYIGFPVWWDVAPHVINTFIETHNLKGKTIRIFATSGGSTIANSERELRKTYPQLDWEEGRLLNGASKAEIEEWITR